MQFRLRPVRPDDCAAVARIYNHAILNTTATFEESAVEASEMEGRIAKVQQAELPFFVAEASLSGPISQRTSFQVQESATSDSGRHLVVGYSYARPWHERAAYRFSVETAVYLDPSCLRKGVGEVLYKTLLAELSSRGFKNAIASIALPHPGSIRLHEKLGFEQVAHFKGVGFKFGKWIDVAYFQRKL